MDNSTIWSKPLGRKNPASVQPNHARVAAAPADGVLTQINNATEAILKKHQPKSA